MYYIYIYIYIIQTSQTIQSNNIGCLTLSGFIYIWVFSLFPVFDDGDDDDDFEVTPEEKRIIKEQSEMAAYEWQHKEALEAAANMGIDTSDLDPTELINMMLGRWLRSTPHCTPIKWKGKGVSKGKGKAKAAKGDGTKDDGTKSDGTKSDGTKSTKNQSNKAEAESKIKGEEIEKLKGGKGTKEKKRTLLVSLKDTYQLTTKRKLTKKQVTTALKYCSQTKFIPMSSKIEFKKIKLPRVKVTRLESESEDSSAPVSDVITEYKHIMLPTDYNTLTSEDSMVSSINSAFRTARTEFWSTSEQTKRQAQDVIDDNEMDTTFEKAMGHIDEVCRSLWFDTKGS